MTTCVQKESMFNRSKVKSENLAVHLNLVNGTAGNITRKLRVKTSVLKIQLPRKRFHAIFARKMVILKQVV